MIRESTVFHDPNIIYQSATGHSKTYRHPGTTMHRTVGGTNGWAERRCLYCECLCHQCLYLLRLILLLHVFSASMHV